MHRTPDVCWYCRVELTDANWKAYHQKTRHKICHACHRTRDRAKYEANIEERKAYQRGHYYRVQKDRYQALRIEALTAYGARCSCCGENGIEFLAIDHVHNDGKQHRATVGGGSYAVYRWLKARGFPKEGFQVLCNNCNLAKAVYGRCPHERQLRLVTSCP